MSADGHGFLTEDTLGIAGEGEALNFFSEGMVGFTNGDTHTFGEANTFFNKANLYKKLLL